MLSSQSGQGQSRPEAERQYFIFITFWLKLNKQDREVPSE